MNALIHSRPPDTRILTTSLELLPYFALCDTAKARNMSRVDLASELITMAMRITGILPEGTAVHTDNHIAPIPSSSFMEQNMNGMTTCTI